MFLYFIQMKIWLIDKSLYVPLIHFQFGLRDCKYEIKIQIVTKFLKLHLFKIRYFTYETILESKYILCFKTGIFYFINSNKLLNVTIRYYLKIFINIDNFSLFRYTFIWFRENTGEDLMKLIASKLLLI